MNKLPLAGGAVCDFQSRAESVEDRAVGFGGGLMPLGAARAPVHERVGPRDALFSQVCLPN
jgi:hypothetical protein